MSIYYNYDKILSYNAIFNFIIGERGVGKSYGAKKYVTKHFLKHKKQFVYVRRYKTELKQALFNGNDPIFFNQIKNDKELKNHNLTNNKDTFFIDKEVAGYAIPLSVANILKSSSYNQVDTIIFDEFIIDKGNYHYLQNEVIQFLDVVETIARLRDIKVFFLGNAISITNPYFTFFDLSLPYNSEFKKFKNGLIVVNYIKNLEYRKVKKATRFGQLINNTEYGKYAIDNEFLRDSKSFIRKKSKDSKFYFTLIINGKEYGVWVDYKQSEMFISNDYDPKCPITFTINPDDHNETTILVRCRTSPFFKSIIEYYRLAKLFFDNQQIKNNLLPYLIKYIS